MSAPSSSLFCHELAPGWLQRQYYSSALRSTGLLAALGVVSYDANIRTVMRNATRHSWLSSAPTFGLAAHFVLRGLHIPESSLVWGESKAHGDLLLLNASTHMNRQVGPLVSLFMWYECATVQYPEVPFVGKLDDDAWLQVPGMAAILSAATHWADRKWAAYIGRLECYSWHVVDEGPMMWRSGGSWNKCYRPRGQHGELLVGPNKWNYTGPFAFAKGGANFLSMRPVRHLVATRRDHVALIAGMGWRCTPGSSAWNAVVNGTKVCQHAAHTAWEDVWTGYALAHGEFGPLLLVDLAAGFIDTYGVTTRPSILAWHGRIDTDYPRRAALLKAWSSMPNELCDWTKESGMASCAEKATRLVGNKSSPHHSCVGEELDYCRVDPPKECEHRKLDLLKNKTMLSSLTTRLRGGTGLGGVFYDVIRRRYRAR